MFKPGDVFLTRWFDEEKNSSPGYWNHAAIMDHHGYIVESLKDIGVVKQDFDKWYNSLETFMPVRFIRNESKAYVAGEMSNYYLGKPYRFITSAFRFIGPIRENIGLNCVALVRLCYRDALGYDPRYFIPDDLLKSQDFRRVNGY